MSSSVVPSFGAQVCCCLIPPKVRIGISRPVRPKRTYNTQYIHKKMIYEIRPFFAWISWYYTLGHVNSLVLYKASRVWCLSKIWLAASDKEIEFLCISMKSFFSCLYIYILVDVFNVAEVVNFGNFLILILTLSSWLAFNSLGFTSWLLAKIQDLLDCSAPMMNIYV